MSASQSQPGSALKGILFALDSRGKRYAKLGDGYLAQCPGHEDKTASLSVAQGNKGAVLRCHTGCEAEAIVAARLV